TPKPRGAPSPAIFSMSIRFRSTIKPGFFEVLLCRLANHEMIPSDFTNEVRQERGILRKLRDYDVWKRGAHGLALNGAIINEYEAIQADVEAIGDFRDTLSFRTPFDLHGDKVALFQHHVRMLLKHLNGICPIVLRDNCEHHTNALHIFDFTLKILVALSRAAVAKLDAVNSILTHNASPQRIVQVEDEAFFARSRNACEQPLKISGDYLLGFGTKPEASSVPEFSIVESATSVIFDYLLQVKLKEVRKLVGKAVKCVEPMMLRFPLNTLRLETSYSSLFNIQCRHTKRALVQRRGRAFDPADRFIKFSSRVFPVARVNSLE